MASLFPDVYELRAQAKKLAANGQNKEAIQLYRKLVKKDPAFSDLYAYHLGNLYGLEGPCQDDEQALFWYAKVTPDTVSRESYCAVLRYQGNISRMQGRLKEALAFYQQADQMEDPVTQNVLGILYHYGDGFEQNIDKAVYYYKRAIKNGNTDAMVNLSDIYKKSPDTLYDAITLLAEAYSKNQPDAKEKKNLVFSEISTEDLRTLCRSMPEDKKYGEEHFQYLAERARRNDTSCFYAYGLALKKRNMMSAAAEAFKKSPAKKTGDAYFELGKLAEGEEKCQYFKKCIQYGLEHGITATTKKAMTKLALYYKELGDLEKAIEYNEMAVSHGYGLGYLRLGEIYQETGAECAEEYFLKAYEANQKKAALHLYQYAYNRGDYVAAKNWCEKAPQKEGNQKLYYLAMLYWEGKGTERDEEKAIELLKQSLESKNCPEDKAKLSLVKFYILKTDVDYNTFKEAYQLYREIRPQLDIEEIRLVDKILGTRIRQHFLPENPSCDDYFTLAEYHLAREIMPCNPNYVIRYIVEGLGFSWDDMSSQYRDFEYPKELNDQFEDVIYREVRNESRYNLIALYRPLAEQGHVESMYRLSQQLDHVAKYGSKESQESLKWRKKAAQCGHPALQKNWEPLIGFITHCMFRYPYEIEAIVILADRCAEKKEEKNQKAARLLYNTAVFMYEIMPSGSKRSRKSYKGYQYYCIYLLYCNSLIQDKAKAQEWIEKAAGYDYPPADLIRIRQLNPLPLKDYEFNSRESLRSKYKRFLEWGEIKAEAYL